MADGLRPTRKQHRSGRIPLQPITPSIRGRPVGGRGIGGEYFGRLTMAHSRLRAATCNRPRRGVDHLALLVVRLPLAQFLGSPPPTVAELSYQRDHAGVDADHQPLGFLALVAAPSNPLAPPGRSAMSAPRCRRISSRPARRRSQRFWSAATRQLRLLISRSIVAAERVSCSSRTLEQTTAFNIDGATNWRPGTK